jgi:hypothetical protein
LLGVDHESSTIIEAAHPEFPFASVTSTSRPPHVLTAL